MQCGRRTVDITSEAKVHAIGNGGIPKVRNLCDTSGKAVRIIAGSRVVTLRAGEEIVVGDDLATVESEIKVNNLGRRKVNRCKTRKIFVLM